MKGPDSGQGCWETGREAHSGCLRKPGTVDSGLP